MKTQILMGQLNQIFDGIDSISNALVIIAVNNSMRFGMGFWDRFAVIRFELPNLSERRDFVKSMMGRVRIKADYDELARVTEGMSFRDLEKLCNNVFYKILRGKDINNSTFYNAAKSLKSENLGMEMYG